MSKTILPMVLKAAQAFNASLTLQEAIALNCKLNNTALPTVLSIDPICRIATDVTFNIIITKLVV